MALLSRVADRLYWAARYIERAEDSARCAARVRDVLVDLPTACAVAGSPLVTISGSSVRLPASSSDENRDAVPHRRP